MAFTTEQMRSYMKKYREARRRLARKIVGSSCFACGSKDGIEFDHVDPSTKLASIADALTMPEEKFLEELKKCQPLCRRCHIEKTKEELKVKDAPFLKHGTISSYQGRGCRCETCRSAYAGLRKKYRPPRQLKNLELGVT